MQRTLLFRATEKPVIEGVKDELLEVEKVQGINDALMFTVDGTNGLGMVFIGREDLIRLRNVLAKHVRTLTA